MDDVYLPMVFHRYQRALRGVLIDGQPWLAARDLGQLIGREVEHYVINRLDDDLRRQVLLSSRSGDDQVWLVNDFGVFQLLARYRHPELRSLRRWFNHDVLPSLRDSASGAGACPRRNQLHGTVPPLDVLQWQGDVWMRRGDLPRLLTEPSRPGIRRWLAGWQTRR